MSTSAAIQGGAGSDLNSEAQALTPRPSTPSPKDDTANTRPERFKLSDDDPPFEKDKDDKSAFVELKCSVWRLVAFSDLFWGFAGFVML